MIEIIKVIPWPAALSFATFLVVVVFAIYLLTLRAGLKTNGEITIGKLKISSNVGIFNTLGKYLAEYHRETQEISQLRSEAINKQNLIEYKLRLQDQMSVVERTLIKLNNSVSAIFGELLIKHYGNEISNYLSPEYRALKIMMSDMSYRIKNKVRQYLGINHITEKSDLELEKWKKELVDEIISMLRNYVRDFYPCEYTRPSMNELISEISKIKEKEIKTPLYECADTIVCLAFAYEEEVKTLNDNLNMVRETYIRKWEETFANLSNESR